MKQMEEFDEDIDFSEEHIHNKEKRYISMKKQKQHKQRLLNELSLNDYAKPSIRREYKWDDEQGKCLYTNRIKRSKRSRAQKWMKKTSCHMVRHIPNEELPPKGNHYRKVFDYWWTWL